MIITENVDDISADLDELNEGELIHDEGATQ